MLTQHNQPSNIIPFPVRPGHRLTYRPVGVSPKPQLAALPFDQATTEGLIGEAGDMLIVQTNFAPSLRPGCYVVLDDDQRRVVRYDGQALPAPVLAVVLALQRPLG